MNHYRYAATPANQGRPESEALALFRTGVLAATFWLLLGALSLLLSCCPKPAETRHRKPAYRRDALRPTARRAYEAEPGQPTNPAARHGKYDWYWAE